MAKHNHNTRHSTTEELELLQGQFQSLQEQNLLRDAHIQTLTETVQAIKNTQTTFLDTQTDLQKQHSDFHKQQTEMMGMLQKILVHQQTRTIATDEIQPHTYAFLKHFHKFPVELAALQAQFEKLQDITNQITGIPEVSHDKEAYHYPIVNMIVYDEYEDDNIDTTIFDEYDDEYHVMDDNYMAYPVYDSDSDDYSMDEPVKYDDYEESNNSSYIMDDGTVLCSIIDTMEELYFAALWKSISTSEIEGGNNNSGVLAEKLSSFMELVRSLLHPLVYLEPTLFWFKMLQVTNKSKIVKSLGGLTLNGGAYGHPWDPGIKHHFRFIEARTLIESYSGQPSLSFHFLIPTYLGTSMFLGVGSVMVLEDKDLKGKVLS